MNKLKYIILILIILTTALIITFKPQIIKKVKIDDSKFNVNEETLDTNSKTDKIAWNKWHSDLINKILENGKGGIDEPLNTINFVQFNVDDKKNITNIKITAEPEKYTQVAKNYFLDYIVSLNGNDILKFPANSERKVVLVKLPIIVSNSAKLTTPKDFSDYETVGK